MIGEHDRMPTMQWSTSPPARVRVDIPTTGGVELWAFEHVVRRCFEQATEGCEVRPKAPPVNTMTPTP